MTGTGKLEASLVVATPIGEELLFIWRVVGELDGIAEVLILFALLLLIDAPEYFKLDKPCGDFSFSINLFSFVDDDVEQDDELDVEEPILAELKRFKFEYSWFFEILFSLIVSLDLFVDIFISDGILLAVVAAIGLRKPKLGTLKSGLFVVVVVVVGDTTTLLVDDASGCLILGCRSWLAIFVGAREVGEDNFTGCDCKIGTFDWDKDDLW